MKKKYMVFLAAVCIVNIPVNTLANTGSYSESETDSSVIESKVALAFNEDEEFGDIADYMADDEEQCKSDPIVKEVTCREIFERAGAYVLDAVLDAHAYVKSRYVLCRQYVRGLIQKIHS